MDAYDLEKAANKLLDARGEIYQMSYNDVEDRLKELERHPSPSEKLLDRINNRLKELPVQNGLIDLELVKDILKEEFSRK